MTILPTATPRPSATAPVVGSTRRITLLPDSSQFMLALQPDLQYVIKPDTTRAIPNALALQLRFEITF